MGDSGLLSISGIQSLLRSAGAPVVTPLCPADSHKQLEHLEAAKSSLKNELVLTKEALSHATLEKEVLEEEKAKAAEALAKARRPLEVQDREGGDYVLGPPWLEQ